MVREKKAINVPITMNSFLILGKVEDKTKKEASKLNYPTKNLAKLQEAIHCRSQLTKKVFATEKFGVAQSIAENSESLIKNLIC